jgi:putative DNA methylase
MAGRMGTRLMAVVAEGERGRVFVPPTPEIEAAAREANPTWRPEGEIAIRMTGGNCTPYGLTSWGDLFTPRQLVALTTFSDLVQEAHRRAKCDAVAAGFPDDSLPLTSGGAGAEAYGDAVATYLAIAISRLADYGSSIATWRPKDNAMRSSFPKQAIQMTWDFAEGSPFGQSSSGFAKCVDVIAKALAVPSGTARGAVSQASASGSGEQKTGAWIVSTDPPYYSNISYADLSDFYYVWLRRSLKPIFPDLFATLVVPKAEELVAMAHRHGSKEKADSFFLDGMTRAMNRLAILTHPAFPVTIYYAFKQAESDDETGTVSTGWDTFLGAVISAGFGITGTWPMRTEGDNRQIGVGANALASSIVIVCRPRAADTPVATRREFLTALRAELPVALAHLQRGNIAPVDLAQAAIGPGMAVYTRYSQVLDAEGKPLAVRDALALINQTLDEALAEQEGDFDAGSRWALAWFGDHGFSDGPFGDAHTYFLRYNTAENALKQAGIIQSGRAKVRLLRPDELSPNWDPATDPYLTAWEMVQHLVRALESGGESAAATIVAKLGSKAELARELGYRLYTVCDRKRRAAEALSYNGLVQSWPEITRLAREAGTPTAAQSRLFGDTEE